MGNFSVPDFRYNAFSQTFTPLGIGYLANPKEVHTIPASAPYEVFLNEIPRGDSPSTLLINEQGGSDFEEVSFATVPGTGQFRAVYGSDIVPPVSIVGQGTIQFSAADAGKTIECAYYGLGAIIQNQLFNSLLDSTYGKPSFGSGLNTDTISELTTNAGVTVDDILLKDKDIKVDTVSENTTNAGVTIDSALIKDSDITCDNIKANGFSSSFTEDATFATPNGVNSDKVIPSPTGGSAIYFVTISYFSNQEGSSIVGGEALFVLLTDNVVGTQIVGLGNQTNNSNVSIVFSGSAPSVRINQTSAGTSTCTLRISTLSPWGLFHG